MSVNIKGLQELQKNLERSQSQVPDLIESIVNDIGDEFMQEVIAKTPASDNNKLKKNWKKKVTQTGKGYQVEVYNDLEYASQVEYGHKTDAGGWKQGHFMMTITQNDIQRRMDKIGQQKLDKFLKGVFK